MKLPAFLLSFWAGILYCSVQPAIIKSLLPHYGGSPHVWISSYVFFGTVSFLAYAFNGLFSWAADHFRHKHLAYAAFFLFLAISSYISFATSTINSGPLNGWAIQIYFDLTQKYFFLFFSLSSAVIFLSDRPRHSPRERMKIFGVSCLGAAMGTLIYPLYLEQSFGLTLALFLWSRLVIILNKTLIPQLCWGTPKV